MILALGCFFADGIVEGGGHFYILLASVCPMILDKDRVWGVILPCAYLTINTIIEYYYPHLVQRHVSEEGFFSTYMLIFY